MHTHTITVDRRAEAGLLVAALGAAFLTYQSWGLTAAVAAALAAGLVGLRRGLPLPLAIAASAAAGSALVHFAVAPEHFREWWGFGLFFVICAEVQVGWAILLRRFPNRTMLAVGVVGSLLVVAIWIASRMAGLPFGLEAGVPEAVSLPDVVSALLELVTAAACAIPLLGRDPLRGNLGIARAASITAVVALTAWALLAVGTQ